MPGQTNIEKGSNMNHVRSLVLATASILVLAACAQSAPPASKTDPAAEEAAVRAVNAAWFKAYTAGDAAGVAATYADDAVVSPAGAAAARGTEAIRAFFEQDIASVKAAGVTYAPDPATEVGVSGDLAWEAGTFKISAPDGAVVDTGKFTTVLARRDGTWKIVRDTWNSDAPPAGTGKAIRIVRFKAASADAQRAVTKLVDDEIDGLYAAAQGFQSVRYFVDTKTLETGSVSVWNNAADVDAFLQSEGYKPIPGKLKPLMKGPMIANVYETYVPPKK